MSKETDGRELLEMYFDAIPEHDALTEYTDVSDMVAIIAKEVHNPKRKYKKLSPNDCAVVFCSAFLARLLMVQNVDNVSAFSDYGRVLKYFMRGIDRLDV